MGSLIHRAKSRITFDRTGFEEPFVKPKTSDQLQKLTNEIRGADRKPAIMLHGVMPRSGTNYLANLLSLHPDLFSYPHEIWEFPVLHSVGELNRFERTYFSFYKKNREKIESSTFHALVGAVFMRYLYSDITSDQHALLKVPSVRYLNNFDVMFPNENLIILIRDGRDVVSSYQNTFNQKPWWKRKTFGSVCKRWKISAQMAMSAAKYYGNSSKCLFVRYEDVVDDPSAFIGKVCEKFNLDFSVYPVNEIHTLGVKGSSTIKENGAVTWETKAKPRGFNPVGRWSNWSSAERATFKRIAGEMLIDCGYSDDANW